MSERIDLLTCNKHDVIEMRVFDTKGIMVMDEILAVVNAAGKHFTLTIQMDIKGEDVRNYRFIRTRLGHILLPSHLAEAGTTELVQVDKAQMDEAWTVKRNGLALHHWPKQADAIRAHARMN